MTIEGLRARGEADLAQRLLREPEVREALEKIERHGEPPGARRQLLGTAMRLTSEMAPDIDATVSGCGVTVGLPGPVETYVYPGPYFNAAAIAPEGGRFLVAISSSLLEAFDADELRFVVGHELGHFLFEHHRIPVAAMAGRGAGLRAALALQIFAWQRFAEMSADRAGVVCAGSLEPAARALFKLASGLRGDRVRTRIDQFLAQAGELQEEAGRGARGDEPMRPDWFATHPFSPLRLRAADLFARSELMTPGGIPRADLEARVQELMSVMEPSYLTEKSSAAEAMRRLLFAGGVAIAAATGSIDDKAIEKLEHLLGPGSIPFELKPDVILKDLPSRLQDARESVPELRRAQVLRDLCVIAGADGTVRDEERRVLREIAEGIGIDASLVASTLAAGGGCGMGPERRAREGPGGAGAGAAAAAAAAVPPKRRGR